MPSQPTPATPGQPANRASHLHQQFLINALRTLTGESFRYCASPKDLPDRSAVIYGPHSLDIKVLPMLRHHVVSTAARRGISNLRCQELATAAGEAVVNAVKYAGGGSYVVGLAEDGAIQVWVQDRGPGMLKQARLGDGYRMMVQTASRLWLHTGSRGTTVVLELDTLKLPPLPVDSLA